jgi:hypothetical protein
VCHKTAVSSLIKKIKWGAILKHWNDVPSWTIRPNIMFDIAL